MNKNIDDIDYEDDNKLKDKIAPSPFFTNYDSKYIELAKEEGSIYRISMKVYDRNRYTQITNDFLDILINNSKHSTLISLILTIIKKLDYNTNKVKILSSDFDILAVVKQAGNLSRYIDKMEELNIISRTNKRSVYIVNHNYIFKGRYSKFIRTYIKYYKGKVDKNEDGKIYLKD